MLMLVIAQTVVVRDEGVDLGFEIVREEVVLQQNAVLERLMPALGLFPGSSDDAAHHGCAPWSVAEPFGQVTGEVTRSII